MGLTGGGDKLDKMTKNSMKLENQHFGVKTLGDAMGETSQFWG